MLWTLFRIVRDHHTAEDLAQDTYLKVHKALEKGPIEHLDNYLYRTARNLAFDHKRRSKFREKFEDIESGDEKIDDVATGEASAEEQLIEQERHQRFTAALAKLPPRAREAWALFQLKGWTYQEIADHLGVSRNTVYNDIKLVLVSCREAVERLERG